MLDSAMLGTSNAHSPIQDERIILEQAAIAAIQAKAGYVVGRTDKEWCLIERIPDDDYEKGMCYALISWLPRQVKIPYNHGNVDMVTERFIEYREMLLDFLDKL